MEKKDIKIIFEDFFDYKKNILYAEDVSLKTIASEYGTPSFVYSKNYLLSQIRRFKNAFSGANSIICYSVKANSNLNILKMMEKEGYGADVVSEGELRGAILAGFTPDKIVFAGVGKSEEEISYGIKNNINCFNIENQEELALIEKYGKKFNQKVVCNLRLNLDIDVDTHEYVKTSKNETKFGIDLPLAEKIIKERKKYKYAQILGFHLHLGSQLKDVTPYTSALKKVKIFSEKVKFQPKIIDIGGGFGIPYSNKDIVTDIEEFGNVITPIINSMKIESLILEPGRFIVGNTAVLLTKVLYVKKRDKKNFVIVDAAMNDLIRPSIYGSYHSIFPVSAKKSSMRADIVGPICESGDFLGKDIDIPSDIKAGDLIAVASAGAYSFTMSSNYNSRLKPCEILVENKKTRVIRKRETYKDLWKR